jgi:hypothetical protein
MTSTPGAEHIADTVLQHQDRLLDDPLSVTVTDAEVAAAFGPQWRTIRGMVRRAASGTPAEAARLRTAWDSALDNGDDRAAAADAATTRTARADAPPSALAHGTR